MAEHTTHYNITKPTGSEAGDVSIINANMDIIDGQMYENEQAIEEVDTKVGSLASLLTTAKNSIVAAINEIVGKLGVDWIVEQGTSGIWTYEKWASGKAKCWGSFDYTTPNWQAWGSGYFTGNTPSKPYPFTFTRIDSVIPSINETPHVDTSIGIAGGQGTLSTSPAYYLIRPVSLAGTSTIPIGIYVVGRWK